MMSQFAEKMPWGYALCDEERRCLLTLVRKMIDTPSPVTDHGGDAGAGV
jgi:hypothetical protein